jgi:serine-type D-Ala-D-Ala carboxypeptidase (penicillin-binding protein 5/6)
MQNRAPATARKALPAAGIAAVASAIGLAVASALTTAPSRSATAGDSLAGSHAGTVRVASQPHPLTKDEIGGPLLARHGIVVHYPAASSRPLPKVPASAYVIADAGTGQVLAAKDPHGQYPPASTLKMLTAITMLPRLDPRATVLATKLAASVEPNIVGLVPGRRYKVSDLFNALLLISANDAAVALVQASGSFSKGMALVNAEAAHLQAYDVVAKVPNGLPAPGQVVSAYDLALIARQALAMPAFMKYDSTLTARFPVKRHKSITLVNQNYLLTQYRGGIGGKIGWTMKAEATYVGMARRDGRTLIVTILHARPLTEIYSAEKLLNWGFANDGTAKPVGVLVQPLTAPHPTPAATPSHSIAVGSSLARAGRGSAGYGAVTGGILAGLAVGALGGLAWYRRRVWVARRAPASGPAETPPGP